MGGGTKATVAGQVAQAFLEIQGGLDRPGGHPEFDHGERDVRRAVLEQPGFVLGIDP